MQGAGLDERLELERRLCRASLIDFIRAVAPWFVIEEIHLLIAEELEALERGDCDRLMIFMSPRSGKSETISKLFPAWYLGRRPNEKVMQVSYKAELATDFGRQVRELIKSPAYQHVFPGVELRADVKAAGHWMITHKLEGQQQGEYYASGITGGIAGRGWNLGIIDDPLSEQDAVSDVARAFVRNWYGPGFYTRRQPERNVAVIMTTRWTADDLPGYLLDLQENDPQADRWRVIEIPAFVDAKAATQLNAHTSVAAMYDEIRRRAPGKPTAMIPSAPLHYRVGDSYAPRRYSTEKLDRTRGNVTERTWSALYLQRPVAESGHILKRDAWREWKQKEPPECYEIIACYDTAIEEDEEADYSARTTWGLFEFQGMTNAILIEAWRDRLPPHEILDEMKRHTKEFKVDRLLIEKRASGSWLVKEGRRRNLPTRAWLPPGGPRSKGKVPRAHAASVVLEGGAVWYVNRRWAQTVIDEAADFPFGAHDDLCLVAGTQIAVRCGMIPIEDVRIGDEVLTPFGWRRVIAAGPTGIRPVVKRGHLTGTPGHPVFTLDRGWERLADLTTESALSRSTLCGLIKTIRRMSSSSMGSSFVGWAAPGDTISASRAQTLDASPPKDFMWRFGSIMQGKPFLMGVKLITKIATPLTTGLKIWSAYRRLCIEQCLSRACKRLNDWRISLGSASKHLSGIARKKVANGTGKMHSAMATASPDARHCRVDTMGRANARFAAQSSSAGTLGGYNAAMPAQTESGKQNVAPVYNLSVADAECYFANGVLVHNCDTTTMALLFLRERWRVELKVDHQDDEPEDEDFEPLERQLAGIYG